MPTSRRSSQSRRHGACRLARRFRQTHLRRNQEMGQGDCGGQHQANVGDPSRGSITSRSANSADDVIECEKARVHRAVLLGLINDCADEVTLSRKGAKSRTHRRSLRATRTKAKAHVEHVRDLQKQLAEALERQAATSQVLRAISGSQGDLQPVFETILAHATRICGAKFGMLNLYDGDSFRTVAFHNAPPAYVEARSGRPFRPQPESGLGDVERTRQIAHIEDVRARQVYLEGDPVVVALADLAGARTLLIVPMLKDNELIGTIGIYRQEVRPFTDKQIELVQNFAAQAVIAIENTRLLNELRQRTDDLSEALEQQTATSEVLSVISSSPGELDTVFRAMLSNALRICEAKFGNLFLFEGGAFREVSNVNTPSGFQAFLQRGPVAPNPGTGLARIVSTKQVAHIEDVRQLEAYASRDPFVVAGAEAGGIRTLLIVPMLKEDELIGVIGIYRQEVRPFTEKQIELVQNFARQAVIAVENTRLLNELRESLQQQTAT